MSGLIAARTCIKSRITMRSSVQLRGADGIWLRLLKHLQRCIERVSQVHGGRRATAESPARDEPYVYAVVMMGNENTGAQLHLYDTAHDTVGRCDIEIDGRYIGAVFKGRHIALAGRVHVGRFGQLMLPAFVSQKVSLPELP